MAHIPVLCDEVIGLLKEGGLYLDATTGLGGHSEKILKSLK